MRRPAASLSLAFLLAATGAASGQAPDLEPVLARLAASWSRGDAAAIAALASRDGVSLEIERKAVGPLSPRQAAAMLRRLFEERVTVQLSVGMVDVVGGAPRRAFGELTWMARVRGTSIPERATVFLALVQEDGWRLTHIRLLP
ncbi:MAG: hypothetical protein HY703_03080 [Gemmatimonadetes bacterium]|nr:hypothetical protein [Gemmatimonadota bacterium]